MAPEVSPDDLPSGMDNRQENQIHSQGDLEPDQDILDDENALALYNNETQSDSVLDISFGYTALGQASSDEESDDDGDYDGEVENDQDDNFAMTTSAVSNENVVNVDGKHEDIDTICHSEVDDEETMLTSSSAVTDDQRSENVSRLLMTNEHALAVMDAIADFKLPTDNVPEWAKHIPEENWKANLTPSVWKK